jgi:uncharacterized protein YuzE
VVLLERISKDEITRDHQELSGHLDAVLDAVASPDHVAPHPREGRERYHLRTADPSRSLSSVLCFKQEPARIRHRGGAPEGPQAMDTVNIRVGPLVFDHADYDAESDVLYLHVGPAREAEGEETPEGHLLRFAPGTHDVVGLTVVNARWLLEHEGHLAVSVPEHVEARQEDVALFNVS